VILGHHIDNDYAPFIYMMLFSLLCCIFKPIKNLQKSEQSLTLENKAFTGLFLQILCVSLQSDYFPMFFYDFNNFLNFCLEDNEKSG